MKIAKKIKRRIKIIFRPAVNSWMNRYYPDLLLFKKKQYHEWIMNITKSSTQIVTTKYTFDTIYNHIDNNLKGAYMRFGDGDAYLAVGIDDILQSTSDKLKDEMCEAFSLVGMGIYKSLSIHSKQYGYEDEMYIGNHLLNDETAKKLLGYTFPFFIGQTIYSPIFLHYFASYYPELANRFIRKIKEKSILFIGNETIDGNVLLKLFGEVPHIKTPPENAYDSIDELENLAQTYLDKINNYGVVVVAMGCSGRVLMKRLLKNNYNVFYFDFGSLLDGICGNKSREWLKEVAIDYEALLKDL